MAAFRMELWKNRSKHVEVQLSARMEWSFSATVNETISILFSILLLLPFYSSILLLFPFYSSILFLLACVNACANCHAAVLRR